MKLRRRHQSGLSKVLILLALIILLGGAASAGYQLWSNRINDIHIAQEIERANRDEPSSMPATTKPDDDAFANHEVSAGAPRYIFIPKISVKAMVMSIGLTKDNTIEAPHNVHNAGWYTKSANPGQPGAVIIDGHVANWATKSVFHDVKDLKQGDTIRIERGDGVTFTYQVVESQSYAANTIDMKVVLNPVNSAKPGLNLITCDGNVVKGNKFDRRLVVFAQQL